MNALIIVCPQTNLDVPFGNRIIPIVNNLIDKFEIVVVSKYCQKGEDVSFYPNLNLKNSNLFTKYVEAKQFPTSAFDAQDEEGVHLDKYLKLLNVEKVFVAGLMGEYSVKQTAQDLSVFFDTYFIIDAIKFKSKINETLKELEKDEINIINSKDVLTRLSGKKNYKSKKSDKSDKSNKQCNEMWWTDLTYTSVNI